MIVNINNMEKEYVDQYSTQLQTGEIELSEEELGEEQTLMEKTMGKDFANYFEV